METKYGSYLHMQVQFSQGLKLYQNRKGGWCLKLVTAMSM